MALQLADRSIKYPAGILEDVPLKIGEVYVPVDFVVLDMDEDSKVPIILGRPFLSTADAIVHVRAGRLTMKIGDEIVEFSLDQNLKQPSINATVCYADILEATVVEASLYSNWKEIEEIRWALDGQETEKDASEVFRVIRLDF
ncbi:PREDICTED: uncharacterized protein LOC104808411 [Tarenaya hassleriana]|uniref:uncharacterized protein LOC104808411 n=1 Tax=Tarenaya hassleriana TaxID=28532 RepID=UPI00053C7B8B|nr:PREDICTED: uncharacterized protein LOC104808411 [Tarenaya hassleriana]